MSYFKLALLPVLSVLMVGSVTPLIDECSALSRRHRGASGGRSQIGKRLLPLRHRRGSCSAEAASATFTHTLEELKVRLSGRSELFGNIAHAAEAMLQHNMVDYHDVTWQLSYYQRIYNYTQPWISQHSPELNSSDTLSVSYLINYEVKTLLERRFAIRQPEPLRTRIATACDRMDDTIDRVAQRIPVMTDSELLRMHTELGEASLGTEIEIRTYMNEIGFRRALPTGAAPVGYISIVLADANIEVLVASPNEWFLALAQHRNPRESLRRLDEGNTERWGVFYYIIRDRATGRFVTEPTRLPLNQFGIYQFYRNSPYRFVPLRP